MSEGVNVQSFLINSDFSRDCPSDNLLAISDQGFHVGNVHEKITSFVLLRHLLIHLKQRRREKVCAGIEEESSLSLRE